MVLRRRYSSRQASTPSPSPANPARYTNVRLTSPSSTVFPANRRNPFFLREAVSLITQSESRLADDVALPRADAILRRRLARADEMTRHFLPVEAGLTVSRLVRTVIGAPPPHGHARCRTPYGMADRLAHEGFAGPGHRLARKAKTTPQAGGPRHDGGLAAAVLLSRSCLAWPTSRGTPPARDISMMNRVAARTPLMNS